MPYTDLQHYLTELEGAGKLHHVVKLVDPSWEIAAVTRYVFDRYSWDDRPALCFDSVQASEYPLVVGVVGGSPSIYALALCTTIDQIPVVWERALQKPVNPVYTETGIVKEIIKFGSDVDVRIFPHSVWTPGFDPGPYITAPLVVTKDPETGVRNVGTYRLQVKGPRQLGIYIGPEQHGARHLRKCETMQKDMPVAIVIGADPAIVLASVTKIPYGTDEFAVAGGLRNDPVPVTKCETVDLEVPANAEIVLEGVIRHGVRSNEGPFGEYTGYMGPSGSAPVVDITCLTRRARPIYQAFLSQMPPSESSCIRSMGRSATLRRHLNGTLSLPVTDVHFTESGGSNGIIVVALIKEHSAQVKEIAWATWSFMNKEGKILIVVDDDIDIRSSFQVEWALSFRVQPARDIYMADGTVAMGLDPSIGPANLPQNDSRRRFGSKLLIDATKKHSFPSAARVPLDYLRTIEQNWNQYGFK